MRMREQVVDEAREPRRLADAHFRISRDVSVVTRPEASVSWIARMFAIGVSVRA
jgi:hypothetical protein